MRYTDEEETPLNEPHNRSLNDAAAADVVLGECYLGSYGSDI